MKLVHGGDVEGYKEKYGREPVDFSANVSPLGLPIVVREAIIASLDYADRYPDPLCRELCKSIGESEDVNPSWVVCANGASDVLYRLVLSQKPQHALLTAPTFAGYEEALRVANCECKRHFLKRENEFDLTERILDDITEELDLVFICNPNNPTGRVVEQGLLEKILKKCERVNCLLLVDECFNAFLENSEQNTMKPFLHSPNLLILKAHTKQYAMAGVRLGYALSSNADLIHGIWQAGQAWSVSYMAQKAGVALAGEKAYTAELKEKLLVWKAELLLALHREYIHCIGGSANYVFFYTAWKNFYENLAERGILIRSCDNYIGLEEGYYRVAVRNSDDIAFLSAALSDMEQEKREIEGV